MTPSVREQVAYKLGEFHFAANDIGYMVYFKVERNRDNGILYIFDRAYYNKVSMKDSYFWLTDSVIEIILTSTDFDAYLYHALMNCGFCVESAFMVSLKHE